MYPFAVQLQICVLIRTHTTSAHNENCDGVVFIFMGGQVRARIKAVHEKARTIDRLETNASRARQSSGSC